MQMKITSYFSRNVFQTFYEAIRLRRSEEIDVINGEIITEMPTSAYISPQVFMKSNHFHENNINNSR